MRKIYGKTQDKSPYKLSPSKFLFVMRGVKDVFTWISGKDSLNQGHS